MKYVEFSGTVNTGIKSMAIEMKYCVQADLMQRGSNLYGFSNYQVE